VFLREPEHLTETRAAWDAFAGRYAERFRDEFAAKVWDRALLSGWAELAGPGPVVEAGCGPGVLTAWLHDSGLDVTGVDLSPEMVKIARRDHPHVRYEVGTMTALDRPDASQTGIVAWYSIINVPDEALPEVFAEFHRVLVPGGVVALAFQVGDETLVRENITFRRRRPEHVAGLLTAAGLTMVLTSVREPSVHPGLTEAVPQAYLVARRP
jgi:trans-aconitate methyltransferase